MGAWVLGSEVVRDLHRRRGSSLTDVTDGGRTMVPRSSAGMRVAPTGQRWNGTCAAGRHVSPCGFDTRVVVHDAHAGSDLVAGSAPGLSRGCGGLHHARSPAPGEPGWHVEADVAGDVGVRTLASRAGASCGGLEGSPCACRAPRRVAPAANGQVRAPQSVPRRTGRRPARMAVEHPPRCGRAQL